MYLLKKVNKIALSFNDNKRLQSLNGLKPYLYDASAGRVYKEELQLIIKNDFTIC